MTLLRRTHYTIGLDDEGLYYVYNTKTHEVECVCVTEEEAIEAVYNLM